MIGQHKLFQNIDTSMKSEFRVGDGKVFKFKVL